jgi:sugar O-acyltransferase (sialic acid O-acetyltransferase NeuD family)
LKNKIVIFGTGGFAREIYHLCQNARLVEVAGFISQEKKGNSSDDLLPLSVLGKDEDLPMLIDNLKINTFVSAIGHPATRKKCSEYALSYNLVAKNILHPSSVFLTEIDDIGCIAYPNVTIMNDCNIGRGVLFNSNTSIGHDTKIGDFCNINPGAHIAGKVTVGAGSTVGIGAVVKENIQIGNNVIIGAGSVVVKDIPDDQIVYGNPSKKSK